VNKHRSTNDKQFSGYSQKCLCFILFCFSLFWLDEGSRLLKKIQGSSLVLVWYLFINLEDEVRIDFIQSPSQRGDHK